MQVRLFVINDKANVKKVVLRRDTTIGRSSDCNLRIASQEVSRQHCTILLSDAGVSIRDLDSSNGTFVNGEQIEPNRDVPLFSETEVEIGNVRFRVQHEIPMEDGKSTAEVPNAAVAANVAEAVANGEPAIAPPVAAPVRAPVASEPEDSDGLETLRDVYVDETVSDHADAFEDAALANAETVNRAIEDTDENVGRDLSTASPEDTIAFDFSGGQSPEEDPATDIYDDSQIEAFQGEAAHPEETVSMNADEFHFSAPPAEPEPPPEEPAAPKKSGLKSLFGLLGRKKSPEGPASKTEDRQIVDDAEDDDSTLPENAINRLTDDVPEAEETVAEEQFPEEDDARFEETVLAPEGEFAEEEEMEEEFVPGDAADEEGFSVFPEGEDAPAVEQTSDTDTNLNDFFKQLSQE